MQLGELAQRLGLDGLAPRTTIARLRHLHEQAELPLPVNPRFVCGQLQTGAATICARSLWDRGAVLVWLDHGCTTPPAASSAPPPVSATLRHQLAHRAAELLQQGARQ
jgi:hypothetical protein